MPERIENPDRKGNREKELTFNTSYKLVGICTATSIDFAPKTEICAGETAVTVTGSVTSGGNFTGGVIKLFQEGITDPVAVADVTTDTKSVTYTFTPEAAGDYVFHAEYDGTGSNGYNPSKSEDITVTALNCGCDESFTYVKNEDGTYTFTFIPAEDIEDALLVFTFPQGALDGDPLQGWSYYGQTMQTSMDLVACQEYSWTVSLTCKELINPQNKWTDFKVNDVSKKGNLSNITCD